MYAVVCGKRSSFFEDHNVPVSPPISKRIRCSSSSSSRFIAINRLAILFPDMDKQLLERALNECGDDIEIAIKRLTELQLGTIENTAAGNEYSNQFKTQANGSANVESQTEQEINGEEWVNFFVNEMMNASNMDDARIRASRSLGLFEKSISKRVTADAAAIRQENVTMKEQVKTLIQENSVLKRAVTIQHERIKEYEDRDRELNTQKQMISQYQNQLRTLELNNYSLTMHLKQAQQSNSIPGRFNPDVF